MTLEQIKSMDIQEVRARVEEIAGEMRGDNADIEALNAELEALEARHNELKKAAESRAAAVKTVMNMSGQTIAQPSSTPSNAEIRNSAEYIEAYANYIKTGKAGECRALLTENAEDGMVPIPEFIEERIRTAWDREEILRRVSKSYYRGNLKIGFEITGDDAHVHAEGDMENLPPEEELTLGIVNLVPQTIKKWITVSDEVTDMAAREFLEYIYDELAYKIAKKAADNLVQLIATRGTASTATSVGVATVTAGVSANTIIAAEAQLSDEAFNNVVIMNKQTWAAFKSITTGDGYLLADPFDGLEVLFNDTLPAYSAASAGQVYAIVGSLETGARINYPAGEEIKFVFDELSLAEKDLVKIVGRRLAAMDIVAPGRFVNVKKPA